MGRELWGFALLGVLVACATSTPMESDDSGTPDAAMMDVPISCGSMTQCGSQCTDTAKDPNNCGTCGTKCKPGQYCAASKCNDNCIPPLQLCGQYCVDLDSDHDNCGMCGKGCTVDQVCASKSCVKKCAPGLTACDMTCADLTTDHDHCGDCNTTCAMNEICTGGICCAQGQVECSGACSDLTADANNCGVCGFACGGGTPFCVKGKCAVCNPAVLLVMDATGANTQNKKFAQALNSAGIPTTLFNNGIETYSGNPPATQFGAVLVSGGDETFPAADMPAAGQQSIVSAKAKGIGIVLVEPLQYSVVYNSYLSTLSSLFLATGSSDDYFYDSGPPWPKLTKTTTNAIWNGVKAPVDLNPLSFVDTMQATLANGASQIAQCSAANLVGTPCNGAGTILVKSSGGRTAHFNGTINDSTYAWANNADIVKLMVNAVSWVTNCQ